MSWITSEQTFVSGSGAGVGGWDNSLGRGRDTSDGLNDDCFNN